ncbi:MAG: hypothetical protein L0Y72_21960 [Gemmataceae bacterium]|nr:hypothetical protein [Gemmataceae bacterium]
MAWEALVAFLQGNFFTIKYANDGFFLDEYERAFAPLCQEPTYFASIGIPFEKQSIAWDSWLELSEVDHGGPSWRFLLEREILEEYTVICYRNQREFSF